MFGFQHAPLQVVTASSDEKRPSHSPQNSCAGSVSPLSSFSLIWKRKVIRHQRGDLEGRKRCESHLLSRRKKKGEKANYGWRWWWKACVAHSRQATCPAKVGFPSVPPPFARFYLLSLPSCLSCSAWGTSSGSDLTCHESTVIPPLQVTCPVCVCVCAWVCMCVEVNVSGAVA